MRATATTFPTYVRQSSTPAHRTFPRQTLRSRFRYLIEATDWDETLLAQEKWINRICVGIVILSALYFAPILLLSFR